MHGLDSSRFEHTLAKVDDVELLYSAVRVERDEDVLSVKVAVNHILGVHDLDDPV